MSGDILGKKDAAIKPHRSFESLIGLVTLGFSRRAVDFSNTQFRQPVWLQHPESAGAGPGVGGQLFPLLHPRCSACGLHCGSLDVGRLGLGQSEHGIPRPPAVVQKWAHDSIRTRPGGVHALFPRLEPEGWTSVCSGCCNKIPRSGLNNRLLAVLEVG